MSQAKLSQLVNLENKRGLIMGLANARSIAWGITQAMQAAGARLALTYQGEVLQKRVQPLAQDCGAELLLPCDVTDDKSVDALFAKIQDAWGGLDFLVHAIAFADKDELTERYLKTSPQNFSNSLLISCYSFTALARRAEALMKDGGAMLTLTYLGASKAIPHYNVMGVAKAALEASVRYLARDLGPKNIRVNAISAGPIKTLAAAGIRGLRDMLQYNEQATPLRKNITIEEVGKSALYLLSDLSSGVTGEVHYVDAGYNIIGMHLDET